MNNQYYNENAQDFFDGTCNVEMSSIYQKFLPLLAPKSYILDAGCGSGRDSLAFIESGFNVEAFDASEALVKLAREKTKVNVVCDRFLTFNSDINFDAIWACSSLLHVPMNELNQTFSHLSNMLKLNGIFYCSFKYGNNEVTRNGRHFTNLDENLLGSYIKDTSLEIKSTWQTSDLRPGRENEKWLNAILLKVK